MAEQTARVDREKTSYDVGQVHAESTKLHLKFAHVFHCPNSRRIETHYDTEVARLAVGAEMLDYGCYDGWMIPQYHALQPKKITGIDISEKGIAAAREQYGHLATFEVGDAHAMPFAENSFDLVVGRAILHHLDFDLALKEIRRVLRPGGSALFIEPLGDNPLAKLIRRVTPKARTLDEAPLSRNQIEHADRLFAGRTNHLYANLVSVPVAAATSLLPLESDNVLLRASDGIDQFVSRTPLRFWMRIVALCWTKPGTSNAVQ